MQPYMREANTLKRADQVMQLHDKICTDDSFKIDLTKITEPIQAINLAWVLAICCCGHMEFKDLALNAKSESIRKKLIDWLHRRGELIKLKPIYYDEVDLVYAVTVTQTLSYEIPCDLVVELILTDPTFSKLCTSYHDFQQQTKQEPITEPQQQVTKETISELRQVTKELQQATKETIDEFRQKVIKEIETDSLQQVTKGRAKEKPSNKTECKPSAKGSAKSELIRIELEKIVDLIGKESKINREILWSQFIMGADDPNSPFTRFKNKITDKFTGRVWTIEEATYQLNVILAWHKETHAHLYID